MPLFGKALIAVCGAVKLPVAVVVETMYEARVENTSPLAFVTLPVLPTLKRVVVADEVDDATVKRLSVEPVAPGGEATESCAQGVEVPMPTLPAAVITSRLVPFSWKSARYLLPEPIVPSLGFTKSAVYPAEPD